MTPLVSAHLASHHGIITRRELLALGITQRQLEGMVAKGALVRVHLGVYRHAAAPVTLVQRIHAGLMAAGDGAVVSHRTAIELHGARNFSCQLVELTNRSTSLPLRDGLIVHRSLKLGPADLCRKKSFWVTTPARTLVDACAVMSPAVVVKIAQEWMAQRVVRPDDVDAAMVRLGNLRHVKELRVLLANRDILEADSVPEADLGLLLAEHGLPPTLHVLVTTPLGATFELDWAYPEAMVGLELDGYGIHLRSADAFDGDRDRRNELVLCGWDIFNFSKRMCRRKPARVVDQVRRALALSRTPP